MTDIIKALNTSFTTGFKRKVRLGVCSLTLQVHGGGKHRGPGVLVAGPRHDTTLGPGPGQVGPGVVGAHGGRRVPVTHLRA